MPDQVPTTQDDPAPRPLRLFTFPDLDMNDPATRRAMFIALREFGRAAEFIGALAGDAEFYRAGLAYTAHGLTPNMPMPPEALAFAAEVLRDVVQRVAIGMPAEGEG
jgi:hypothetical protein